MSQFSSNKILKHLDRVLEWQQTGFSRPVTYELDMTNTCDSRCSFCFGYRNREENPFSLRIEEVRDMLDQIRGFGGMGVTFTGGGEPLCNRDTFKAVKYAKEIGLDVGFITNGIMLDRRKCAALAEYCTWVRVSLDAGSKKYYRLTHGLDSDTFQKVIENTAMLVEEKKRTGSSVTVGTGFLTFPEITGEMEKFVDISSGIGVDYAQFRPLLKGFNGSELNSDPGGSVSVMDELKNVLKKSRNGFRVLYSLSKYEKMEKGCTARKYRECFGHNFATVIAADKKMYLCCHMRGVEKYCIGDLSRDSLKEIWSSRRRAETVAKLDFRDCPLLCRCDGINEVLWDITRDKEHCNFL